MFSSTEKKRQWRSAWPAGLVALIAVLQLLISMGIIAAESMSMVADFYHSIIYAGFYCSLFFVITWISNFTVSKLDASSQKDE